MCPRLSSLGPFVGLDHVFLLYVGTVGLLPDIALVAEFVHLAGIDRSVLLAARKADHPQGLEGEWTNSVLEGSHVLEKNGTKKYGVAGEYACCLWRNFVRMGTKREKTLLIKK